MDKKVLDNSSGYYFLRHLFVDNFFRIKFTPLIEICVLLKRISAIKCYQKINIIVFSLNLFRLESFYFHRKKVFYIIEKLIHSLHVQCLVISSWEIYFCNAIWMQWEIGLSCHKRLDCLEHQVYLQECFCQLLRWSL